MAILVGQLFDCQLGLGITGSPTSSDGPGQFAYLAVAHNGRLVLEQRLETTEIGQNEQKHFAHPAVHVLKMYLESS